MNLLLISLTNLDYKEDVFLALQSIGIQTASVWDAQNLNKSLESEFSLFSGFFSGGDAHKDERLIIFSHINEKNDVKEFLSNLEEAGVPINSEDVLNLYVIPSPMVFNHKNGLIEE